MEAIRAGTANAALTLGMEDEIGTLEEGKLADILVVDGDPLADIAVLQDRERLTVVMKDGAIVDTEAPIPEPARYNWEKPMLYWEDPRMPTQSFRARPREQQAALDAAGAPPRRGGVGESPLPPHGGGRARRELGHGAVGRRHVLVAVVEVTPDRPVVREVAVVLAPHDREQDAVLEVEALAEDHRAVAVVTGLPPAFLGEDVIDVAVAAARPVAARLAGVAVAAKGRGQRAQALVPEQAVERVAEDVEVAADDHRLPEYGIPEAPSMNWRMARSCAALASRCSPLQPNCACVPITW